jgi:valyl-tRNA synthetase
VEKIKMKKIVSAVALASAFATGAVLSAQIHDWHDLEAVHKHVIESIQEMEHARNANHYDMMGHGVKAEEHLRAAERELGQAIDSAKAAH